MHLKADKRKLTIRRPYYNPLKILFGIPTVVLKPLLKFFDLVILCLISRSINNHR